MNKGILNCLYYPFSRLLNESILKYLLLIYDSVTFIDEVDSPSWRRKLMHNLSIEDDNYFSSYEKLSDNYDMLMDTNVINIINPNSLKASNSQSVAISTISDINDNNLMNLASNPSHFGLPYRSLGKYGISPIDRPTWQVFIGKIASPLLNDNLFLNNKKWISQILIPGDINSSWTLSYEAGSTAVTNFYLEAANELGLTPITTSELHHKLVLLKLKRIFSDGKNKIELIDDIERIRFRSVSGQGEIIRLLGELYPPILLNNVSFDQILKFRSETHELRHDFIRSIEYGLRVIDGDPSKLSYDKDVINVIYDIKNQFKVFENNLISIRDKLLPAFTDSLMYGSASVGLLGSFVSYLSGFSPAGVVVASSLTVTGAFLSKAINIWNEEKELIRKQKSSISYLAKISKLTK